MTLRLSTGLRNALLDKKATANNIINASDISFEDGTGTDGRDRILSVAEDMSVYVKRSKITVSGSTLNDGSYEVLAHATGYVEVAAGSLSTETAITAGDVTLVGATGGSFSDLFQNCICDIYTGSQPVNADSAETGSKLLSITLSSGAFTGGISTNGLNFGEVISGVLGKEVGEVWSGIGLVAGTAGWFRFYANDYTTGASTSAIRMDGAVATSGAQFNISNTSISVGATTTVDSVALTLPAN